MHHEPAEGVGTATHTTKWKIFLEFALEYSVFSQLNFDILDFLCDLCSDFISDDVGGSPAMDSGEAD